MGFQVKRISACMVVGTIAIAFGSFWFFQILYDLFLYLIKADAFALILLIMAIPGGLAIYFGFQLLIEKSKANIKGTAGITAFFCAFLLVSRISSMIPEVSVGVANFVVWLLATGIAIVIYIALSKFLMAREGLSYSKGEFIGRGILLILSFEIWLFGSELAAAFIFTKEMPGGWIGIVGGFGPIVLACLFYKLTERLLEKNRPRPSGRLDFSKT